MCNRGCCIEVELLFVSMEVAHYQQEEKCPHKMLANSVVLAISSRGGLSLFSAFLMPRCHRRSQPHGVV